MGRHAAAPAPDGPDSARPASTENPPRPWWREAVVFAVAGAVATGAVLTWAVGEWWVAVIGAIGAAAVVVASTWVARSVPAPEK